MIDYIWWFSLIVFASGLFGFLIFVWVWPGKQAPGILRVALWISLCSLIGASLA